MAIEQLTGDGEPELLIDSDDPEFRRGLEAGQLWAFVQLSPVVSMTVHAENAEMVLRIAEAAGRPFTAEPVGDDWLDVTIGAA